jgi:hypothetical protein
MLNAWLDQLEDTAIATAIREGGTLFPWIECVHVLALTLVFGSIAVVDLRLLGWASKDRSVVQTAKAVLPITWCAFALAVVTGSLLFASNAGAYAHNRYFQVKMLMIAAAGLNMVGYHAFVGRGAAAWATPELTPLKGRIVGAVSLTIWITVVACGRWIGFTLSAPT